MKKSAKGRAQLLLNGGQHLADHTFGIGVRQGAVISAKHQGEGEALLTFGHTGAAVDVEQLHILQQLSSGLCDDFLGLSHSNGLVTQQSQVAGDRGILGQGV